MKTQRAATIRERVVGETAFLRRRRLMMALTVGAFVFALPLLGVAAFDCWRPVREPVAFVFCAGWAGVALVVCAIVFRRFRRRAPTVRDVALMVEASRPELMDSLICAVEALTDAGRTTPLHEALRRRVEAALEAADIHNDVRRHVLPGRIVAALVLLAVTAVTVLHVAPLAVKARAHLADIVTGRDSGLTVTPGNTEVAVGDDLVITAAVRRGPERAEVVITDARRKQVFNMYPGTSGKRQFDVYGVLEPFSYTVRTPTLAGAVYHVGVFVKPAIERCRVTIRPPPYTGLPQRVIEELRDFAVPAGGEAILAINTSVPVQAFFVTGAAAETGFEACRTQAYRYRRVITESLRYRLALVDAQGHRVETNRDYAIECVRDFPPVIQVVSPADDAVFRPDDLAPFTVKVTDEYGVGPVDLVYAVNGGRRLTQALYTPVAAADAQKQIKAIEALELDGFVEEGDVIAYFVRAADNAVPEPHGARTEMRFIEIRPEIEPVMTDGNGGKKQALRVSDLIVEQKQLIRQTWDLTQEPDDGRRALLLQEAAKAASDLRVTAQKRYNDIKVAAGGGNFGRPEELFTAALEAMRDAERRLHKSLADESLRSQQRALSRLVALEIELLRNSMQSRGQGEGEGGQPPDRTGDSRDGERNKSSARRRQLEQLEQQIAKLESLGRRQQRLNAGIRDAAGAPDAAERFQGLGGRQRAIEADAEDVRRALRDLAQARPAAGDVGRAVAHMSQAAGALGDGQGRNAGKHGELARQFLERGRQAAEQLRDNLRGGELAETARRLDALRRQQEAVRRETGAVAKQAERKSLKGLMAQQQRVRQEARELVRRLAAMSADLEDTNPSAAAAVTKGLTEAEERGMIGKMKRAENALRYKRPGRAQEFQQRALEALDALAASLDEARLEQPPPGREELARMLAETLQLLQESNAGAKSGRQTGQGALTQRIARHTADMAERLNDERMQALAGEMQGLAALGPGGDAGACDARVTAVLTRTAKLLERRLFEATMKQKLDLTRVAGHQAPDHYRKLVSEYFKNLSDGN